jgi:hypothetical protein
MGTYKQKRVYVMCNQKQISSLFSVQAVTSILQVNMLSDVVNYNYAWEQKHTDVYHNQIMLLKALDRRSTAKIQSHMFLLSKVIPVSPSIKKKWNVT